MTLSEQLLKHISGYHLLQHPFYQAWMEGTLTKNQLKTYAVEYLPYMRAFPRYVSAVHSHCADVESRKLLLKSLMEEEGYHFDKSHPKLWEDFSVGMGVPQQDLNEEKIGAKAKEVEETFLNLCQSGYTEGLAALYTYQHQISEISLSKIKGLKESYQIDDKDTLYFFDVHSSTEKANNCARMINALPESQSSKLLQAGERAAKSLWNLLTEVNELELYKS